MRCLVCKKEFDAKDSTSVPFCSPRCKQIDLGRWLSEANTLPVERSESDADESDTPREED